MAMVHQTHVLVGACRCSLRTERATPTLMLPIMTLTTQAATRAKRMRTRMERKTQPNTSLMLEPFRVRNLETPPLPHLHYLFPMVSYLLW